MTYSKTAEFARLFDLFDRIATRRSRALAELTSEVISADDIANVPAEFAPLLRNLSAILSSRARCDEERDRRVKSTTNPFPNASACASFDTTSIGETTATPLADAVDPSDQIKQDAERRTFPLGAARFPFTFKLMLHKLYDLEEWLEKVTSAVETSQSQFKPLAERVQHVVRNPTERRGSARQGPSVLGASAKFKPPSAARRSRSGAMARDASKERGEKRSGVRPSLGASAKFRPSQTHACPPEAGRVLKKRCIGRRKSISGPASTGVWVYDAAISAFVTEVAGPRPAVEITLSAPWSAGGATIENRVRHRSLTTLEEIQTRNMARRKVKITVPLLQEEGAESVSPQPSLVLQGAIETRSMKKRSMVSVFTPELCKRAAVKRPLCV